MDACHYLLFLVHELILMYEYRHGINAGGNMLEGNTIFFKCLQYLSAETDLGVHHIFFNIDGAEALLAGDTGDHVFGLLTGASHDPGTIVLGSVCIADIDRDTFLTYRENGILMKNGSTHIGQLAKFTIGDSLNSLGMINDAGIRNQETGYIGPVLIDIRFGSLGHDGTGDVGTTSGESLHRSVGHGTVEAGYNCFLALCQSGTQYFIGLCCVKFAVLIEEDDGCRINEIIAQIICHDNTVQIFTTGSRVIAAGLCLKVLLNSLELIDKIQIQLQSVDDLLITGFDSIQLCLEALALICQIIAGIQHIRYLGVIGKSFPRCGRYHIFSLLICPDDVSYFFELLCACQRTSTEFHYF